IVAFANRYYGNNYSVVYKRTGERRNVVKVVKPPITPVEVNRSAQSDFLKSVEAMPVPALQPEFLDYKTAIVHTKLGNGVPVEYLHNTENGRFTLSYVIELGNRNDKGLTYALDYIDFIGTDKLTPAQLKTKLFSLGAELSASSSDDEATVSMTGLDKNFEKSVALLEEVLAHPTSDTATLHEFIARTLKSREDTKKDRRAILFTALRDYAEYGNINPQTNDLSNAELERLKLSDLLGRISGITRYEHHILYYGPKTKQALTASLDKLHTVTGHRPAPPPIAYVHQPTDRNKVYFVDYDMAQAEIIMLSKGLPSYDPKMAPILSLYNEYYGGSMASITFQTIRESKALAYAVYSRYAEGPKKEDPYYIFSYVGSQSDKMPESLASMFSILDTMPRADKLFDESKVSLEHTLASERTTREGILWSYEHAKKMGVDYDVRQ